MWFYDYVLVPAGVVVAIGIFLIIAVIVFELIRVSIKRFITGKMGLQPWE